MNFEGRGSNRKATCKGLRHISPLRKWYQLNAGIGATRRKKSRARRRVSDCDELLALADTIQEVHSLTLGGESPEVCAFCRAHMIKFKQSSNNLDQRRRTILSPVDVKRIRTGAELCGDFSNDGDYVTIVGTARAGALASFGLIEERDEGLERYVASAPRSLDPRDEATDWRSRSSSAPLTRPHHRSG